MGNPNWSTPQPFFDRVSAAWGPFGLDAAADGLNTKVPGHYISENEDALQGDWKPYFCGDGGNAWINPPYTDLLAWVTKAAEESDKGLTVVMLLPWGQWAEWDEIVAKRAEIIRVVGRIRFIDPDPPKGKPREQPMGMNILAIFRPPVEGVTWPVGFTGAEVTV